VSAEAARAAVHRSSPFPVHPGKGTPPPSNSCCVARRTAAACRACASGTPQHSRCYRRPDFEVREDAPWKASLSPNSTPAAAELAVEHVVQECGVSRGDVFVQPTGGDNTSGKHRREGGPEARAGRQVRRCDRSLRRLPWRGCEADQGSPEVRWRQVRPDEVRPTL
jgi:hypothetical protein